MNDTERETWNAKRSEDRLSDKNSPLGELRRSLSEPGPWAQRFRRLAEAIAQVESPTPRAEPFDYAPWPVGQDAQGRPQGEACEECQGLLDVYVDAELAGQDVRQRYPALWGHLRTCTDCTAAHDLLFEVLVRERRGEPCPEPVEGLQPLPPSRLPRLSFLEPPAPDAPWIVRLRSRLTGASFGLTFTLTPAYIRNLLTSPQPLPARTRQADWPPRAVVLLADTVPLEDGQVAVEVVATPADKDLNHLHLWATIAGSSALPVNLWAILTWGDQTCAGPVDEQGQVDLGEVSLMRLWKALGMGEGTVEITFEARHEG